MDDITFAIIKPGAVARGCIGGVIHEVEKAGLIPIRLTIVCFNKWDAECFYGEHRDKPFFEDLVMHTSSGPSVLAVLQYPHRDAVSRWREIMGATNPVRAELGTVRQMFGRLMPDNAVHGSDSLAAVYREIRLVAPEWAILTQ